MYGYEASLDWTRRRKRRRRLFLVGLVVLLVLLANLVVIASMESPELSIQSMSVDRIDIATGRVHVSLFLAVFNTNRMDATLAGIEGTISSGGAVLDEFVIDDEETIPAFTNLTVHYRIMVDNAPLPLPDPVLTVEGKARVQSWIQWVTYSFRHSIPLTHSPDADNQPPSADITAPRFVRRDRPATFDGSASFDPDGKVVGWAWDFGDGHRGEGAVVEHAFLTSGMYTVSLTVVDQMGERGMTSVEIRVLPI